MRALLAGVRRETCVTMLYVTHYPEEARGLCDRGLTMRAGKLSD